jgi:glycosyltransferase involved in cell wall biosynthesis
MSNPQTTVVIPAYNCEKTIPKSIQAVLNQKILPDEIIVVDDGSIDGTKMAVQKFKNVRYVHQENAGPATARNQGGFKACGEIILFTDSDCLPQRDWVERIVWHFSDPQTAVVCGSYGIANPESLLARCIHQEILYRHQKLMPQYPRAFGSYNFAIRKTVFTQLKGFDSSYPMASGEDNDLSYRILNAGYKILFEPKALVDHFHTTQVKKYLFEQFRHGFWRAKMYQDHPNMARGDDYTFWKDIIEVPLALLSLVLLVVSFFGLFWAVTMFFVALAGLFSLEIIFGFMVTGRFFESFFWGFIMFLRSYARMAGFSKGLIYIYFKHSKKY